MTSSIKKWLITTPDYPPRLGGLSTYTLCVERALTRLGINFETSVWNSPKEIREINADGFEKVINIHFMAGHFGKWDRSKNINIIHGSEILFFSPNPIKRIVKKLLKNNIIEYFSNSMQNVFISEFTQNKLESFGLKSSITRDMVFHNCIDIEGHEYIRTSIDDEIRFVSIVRDVPHKNIDGVVEILELISRNIDKKVTLFTNCTRVKSNLINIVSQDSLSDTKRDEFYRESHFNVLLSKDHSHKGFYEGFGLTCLEAGKYGVPSIVADTGGLPENVHHMKNGIVASTNLVEDFNKFLQEYELRREWTYRHTIDSHCLETFSKLFVNLEKL